MNKIVSKLKAIKHKEIILAVIAVIVMLLVYFSSFGSSKKTVSSNEEMDYCAKKQQEIQDAISKMDGAGKAQVVVNWSSSVEIVTAQNVTTNGNSTSHQVLHSSGEPIVVKEIYPSVIGVLIVCEGGNDAKVKVDIIMAIATLMDISTDKILVFGMSK